MSNLKFSKGKFSKFMSSKGFYVAIAVCLVGAGAATWLAVDRTITGIENNNNQVIESENQWNEYPLEADTKQPGVDRPAATEPSLPPPYSSSSTSSAELSEPVVDVTEPSEELPVQETLPNLSYVLPVSGEILVPFSNGELIKNVTLNDWRTHNGVDIAVVAGTDVLAAADGTVSAVTNDPLWGTVITIDHIDGRQTIYSGLDKVVPVKVGDSVSVRQAIGQIDGIPCELASESHLHFSMRSDGQWVDPLSVMQKEITD